MTKRTEAKTFSKTAHASAPAAKATAKPASAKAAEDEGGKKEDDEAKAEEGEASEAAFEMFVSKIADGSITYDQMSRLVEVLNSKMAETGGGSSGPEEEMATEDEDEPAQAMVAASERGGNRDLARAEARLLAREVFADETKKASDRAAAVDGALDRFGGRPLGADPKARFLKAYDKLGADGFAIYCDELATEHAMLFSPAAAQPLRAGERRFVKGRISGVDDVALRFQEQGEDALIEAQNAVAQWTELADSGVRVRPKELFVQRHMTQKGFKPPTPAAASA